jgi:serine/threonine protein phosphatase 1
MRHTVALDENKRHFVFGDIHGKYTSFQRLLDLINYDPTTDHIYSVGDLIDRGPDAVSVVKFFQQDHSHAILGNHEQMVLNPQEWYEVWTYPWNGGSATLASLEEHGLKLDWLSRFCASLPICLDVGDDSQASAFRLIHAESPLEWSESDLLGYLASVAGTDVAEDRLLWGRTDISHVLDALSLSGSLDGLNVAEHRSLRTVFCGHTPVTDVISAFNVNWIDTAGGGTLSCMNPVSMEKHRVPIDRGDW